MGGLVRKPKAPSIPVPSAPSAPQVDPATLQAQFNPAEEDESVAKKKGKRKGKKSLIVPRASGQSGIQRGSSKGAGLQVGVK